MAPARFEDYSFWDIPGRYHLLIREGGAEGAEEFRQTFDWAWLNVVPAGCRASILSGWGLGPVFIHWQSRAVFARGKGLEPAYYLHDARKFFFLADALSRFPHREWVTLAVAYELAHAYLFSTGHGAHGISWPRGQEERAGVGNCREAEVYRLLDRWGCDISQHETVWEWCRDNGLLGG
jgi:hypothetical protein